MRLSKTKPLLKTDTLELLPTPKRIRVMFNGEVVADSKNAALLFEKGHAPLYYLPKGDIKMSLLNATNHNTHCPRKGDATYWTLEVGDKRVENAVWGYPEPLAGAEALVDYVAFYQDKVTFFEEDEPLRAHPRDPYHRVDTRLSSRHVKVVHGGETVAETTRPVLLFETDLTTRYYIPAADVRLELLTPSDTTTSCPYKGEASYYSLNAGGKPAENLVWLYPQPLPEAFGVRDLLCFYHEKLDEFYVDGEKLS